MKEIKLKPKEERRISYGHFWIFSNELEKIDTTIKIGEICSITSSEGKRIGIGFFNPHSLIAVRLLTKGPGDLEESFIFNRLLSASEYRKNFGLHKYARVCFGEADLLPGLVVDRYGDYIVADILSAGMENLKDEIVSSLQRIYSPKGIFFRNDSEFRKLEGISAMPQVIGEVPDTTIIEDGGVKYIVPLKAGQKTGFYYDQRDNRNFLAPYFKDRMVLDLYTYVGGFAIKAALCGAKQVWGIDSSAMAVENAQKAAELNGVAETVSFQREDSERALSDLKYGELPIKPDMIILDPPNYVKSRKNLSQAIKHYIKLNETALKGLGTGGLLATASCSHHISRDIFMDIIAQAAAKSGKNVSVIEVRGQAYDHPVLLGMPETEYLHFALLYVR